MVVKWIPKSSNSKWSHGAFNGFGEYYNSGTCAIAVGSFTQSVLDSAGFTVSYTNNADIYSGTFAAGLKQGQFSHYYIEKSYWDAAVASLTQPTSVPAVKTVETYVDDLLQSTESSSLVNLTVSVSIDRPPFSCISKFVFREA